ncbi:hypothetical protein BDC45DRAFT_230952 [Circinella umbellata]|nr:hypothetical protein BDC45DRAFT_230952 [Circinella umbellata]
MRSISWRCMFYYNVYLPDGITFEAIEQKITLLNNLTDWLGEIYYPCVEAYYQYSCPFAFPRCSTSIVNNTESKLTYVYKTKSLNYYEYRS